MCTFLENSAIRATGPCVTPVLPLSGPDRCRLLQVCTQFTPHRAPHRARILWVQRSGVEGSLRDLGADHLLATLQGPRAQCLSGHAAAQDGSPTSSLPTPRPPPGDLVHRFPPTPCARVLPHATMTARNTVSTPVSHGMACTRPFSPSLIPTQPGRAGVCPCHLTGPQAAPVTHPRGYSHPVPLSARRDLVSGVSKGQVQPLGRDHDQLCAGRLPAAADPQGAEPQGKEPGSLTDSSTDAR